MTNCIKNKIAETAEYVALTLDIWSSRAYDAYLGITWITPEFKLYEVFLIWQIFQNLKLQ